jgi:hypothetical protein
VLADVSADDVREIRHVIKALTKLEDDCALGLVAQIFVFLPQLTPPLCDYLVALHRTGVDVARVWLEIIQRTATYNAWQRAWLVYVARSCDLLSNPMCASWLAQEWTSSSGDLLQAEAALALATIGAIDFGELDLALRVEPEAFAPWYVLAVGVLPGVSAEQLAALRGSAPLYERLLTP